MPLTKAICTNCGGALEVDSAKDAAICPHCKTPYIVEKAINLYHTTNNISIDTVNLFSERDFEIKGGKLVKYNGESDHVTIPSAAKTIGNGAFAGMPIASVTIPNSVTEVETAAFQGCKYLYEVKIPSSVRAIWPYAFAGCSALLEIHLPPKILTICDGTFQGCASLKELALPPDVNVVGNSAFEGCVSLRAIGLPERLQTIGSRAFFNCISLQSVTIPSAVTGIGDLAFGGCTALDTVRIHDDADVHKLLPMPGNYANGKMMFGAFAQSSLANVEWYGGKAAPQTMARSLMERLNPGPHSFVPGAGWLRHFVGTPFYRNAQIRFHCCTYCGGKLDGVINKVCMDCRRPKDY